MRCPVDDADNVFIRNQAVVAEERQVCTLILCSIRAKTDYIARVRSHHRFSELPPFGDMGGFGSGSGLSLPPYAQSGTADALIDPFAMPSSRRSRSRAGSFAMQTDTDNSQFGSLSLGQGQSYTSTRPTAPKRTSTSSSLANLPNLNDMPGFPGSSFGLTSGLSGSSGPLLSPTSGHADEAEGLQGPSHASRNIRKFSKRATFSHAQLTIMEDLWAQTEYPSNKQIERCATATGLVSVRTGSRHSS